jgi:hypothetical protein
MWLHGGGENPDVPEKFQRTRRVVAGTETPCRTHSICASRHR